MTDTTARADMTAPKTVAILGVGKTGAGWAARFALMGWTVRLFDTDPDARRRLTDTLAKARASLPALYDLALPAEGAMTWHDTISEAVAGAVWVQDGTPDRLELKRKLYQKVQEHCAPGAVIAASTAAFTLAELQGCATRPDEIIRVTPTPPVYLWPLVSLPPRANLAPGQEARIDATLHAIGMAPIWADAPEAGDKAEAPPILPAVDDDTTVALLRALKDRRAGLGAALARHEATLIPPPPDPDAPKAPVTLTRQVPITWVDYNGHMNEAFYLTAFSNACDQLLAWAGMDAACVAQGHSVFTVETHIRHLDEVNIGDTIRVEARVIEGGGKKFHIWQELFVGDRLCATGEQLLLHMDLTTRRSAPPRADVAAWLGRMKQAHANLPLPEGFGRFVAQRG